MLRLEHCYVRMADVYPAKSRKELNVGFMKMKNHIEHYSREENHLDYEQRVSTAPLH